MPAARGRIAMLVKNSFEYDARVRKEATSLIADGWQVWVVALHAPGTTAVRETTADRIEVIRVARLYGRLAGLAGPSTTTPGVRSTSARVRRFIRPVLRIVGPPIFMLNERMVDRRMVSVVKALRPDVVHAHDLNTLAPSRTAAQRCSAALVYDAHELHRARTDASARQRRNAHRRERRLIGSADLVLTATNTWAEILSADMDGDRPVVIRNVPESSATLIPAKDIKAEIGISARTPLLVYQGSIQRGRGIDVTLEALNALTECHLAVIGYGAYRPTAEAISRRLGVSNRVHFTGPVPNTDLIAWTRGADVGLCVIEDVSFSYRTSLPNKLFEYMHAGVPVVASDFPEMGALVRRTGCGHVCNPGDPASVANAVRAVLADREQLAAAARSASGAFIWETEVQDLLEAYRRLASRGRG